MSRRFRQAMLARRVLLPGVAIAADADAKAVVTTALRCALEGGATQVSMIVPGRADVVMQTALALGFRIQEPYVLMAWRPFGNPGAPGFM